MNSISNTNQILSVNSFLFQGHQFKIYGTNEEPLFLANDIICDLLGMEQINRDRFFRDNKNDQWYITRCKIDTLSTELQERFKKSNKDHIYFFTEKGLYTCLLRSNKPIAQLFHQYITKYLNTQREQRSIQAIQTICESQYKQLEESKSVIQSFDQYKQILSVQNFLFQGNNVRIQGTNNDPIFHCLDVIKVLGCAKANHNKFYQINKGNQDYVITRCDSPGSKSEKFFTETGLYECLFASDSPVAKVFRHEVIQLLKNIRLGVIGLEICNTEELKRQVDEKIKELRKCECIIADLTGQVESLQDDNEHKTQLIEAASKTCTLYREVVYDKDGNIVNLYGGSTTQRPADRDSQHRRSSCNRGLKEAFENGYRVEFEVVETFTYINDDDRKQKERDLILGIDKTKRLNIQIPRPKSTSTSRRRSASNDTTPQEPPVQPQMFIQRAHQEETKEESKQPITLTNMNRRDRTSFPVNVQNLKTFLIDNKGVYPNKRSDNEGEAKMGRFVDTLRQQLNKPDFKQPLSEANRKLLFKEIPTFIANDKEHEFRQNIIKLAQYLNDNQGVYPSFVKGNVGSVQNVLAKFLAHLRESFKHPDKGSIKLTEQRLTFIAEQIPQFNWNDDPFYELRLLAQEIDAFVQTSKRLPRSNQNTAGDIPDDEIKLGFRVWNLLNSLRASTVTVQTAQAKRQFLQAEFPIVYNLIIERLNA